MDVSVFCGIMICIPLVVSWIMIVIEEMLCCNFYTCTCIHFFICKPICTINVYDKHSVFSPDGLIHPFIHLPLSSHLSVYILIIILIRSHFFVSNDHPLYFYISLTGLVNFITHVIQYMYKQISYIIAYYYFIIIIVLRHTHILTLRHVIKQ